MPDAASGRHQVSAGAVDRPGEPECTELGPALMALEDAFRKLPIQRVETAAGMPYGVLIPGIARQLWLAGGSAPQASRRRGGATKKEWRNVARLSDRLIGALGGLSRADIDALNLRPVAFDRLKMGLRILSAWAAIAESRGSSDHAASGAPTKVQPAMIAQMVAQHYEGLTGRRPTVSTRDGKAGGPFVALLAEVYGILGVKASPESQARKLIERSKRARPKSAHGA